MIEMPRLVLILYGDRVEEEIDVYSTMK